MQGVERRREQAAEGVERRLERRPGKPEPAPAIHKKTKKLDMVHNSDKFSFFLTHREKNNELSETALARILRPLFSVNA